MNDFVYKDSILYCENVRVDDIAKQVGTPFYLYSKNTLVRHYHAVDEAFSDVDHLICFSVKASSNVALLKVLAQEGSGADVLSAGEIYRALRAGIEPQKIVFAGVGKTETEIEYALNEGVLMFNVESSEELMLINEVAGRMGRVARVAIRVNPEVDPRTHPHMATGLKDTKFGIPLSRAIAEYEIAHRLPGLQPVGVHQHIGSQILEVEPFEDSIEKLLRLVQSLRELGMEIHYLDIGGGFGIKYKDEKSLMPDEYAEILKPLLEKSGSTVILELGRMIAGNAGILVTRVLYNKQGQEKIFVVVDAAMNDLMRPALYGAYHHIAPLTYDRNRPEEVVDVVGPICENTDFLARDRAMPKVNTGEFLAVFSAGAYGFVMASNYNSRPRVPEILVSDKKAYVIRRRETYEDLIRGEAIPEDIES